MELNQLITTLGGLAETARLFGVKPPSVCGWRQKNTLPELRRYQLNEFRPDVYKLFFQKQGLTVMETPEHGTEATHAGSGDTAPATHMEGGAVAQGSAAEPSQYQQVRDPLH